MTVKRRLSRIAVAALIMAGGMISATVAQAEDLVDFLWGGGDEYGGGRSVVEVTAPNLTTLYVDPSGSRYGRYVGVRAE